MDDTQASPPQHEPAADGRVVVTLFGEPRVATADGLLQVPDRALAIVAFIAGSGRRRLRRAEIRAAIFDEGDADRAAASLRQALARLRRQQAEAGASLIVEQGDEVGLAPGVEADLAAFLEPPAAGDESIDLRRRLALFRGDLLSGFPALGVAFDDWVAEQRETLRAQFLEMAAVATAAPDLLSEKERIELARRALRLDPHRESIARGLMLLLAARGDGPGAEAVYETLRAALARDLGAKPEPETRALLERVRAPASAKPEPADLPALTDERRAGCPRLLILPPLATAMGAEDAALFAAFLEDVTVGLARYRSMTVLAPHTARRVGASGEWASLTGADYQVSTALRPKPDGAAVSVRLTEAASGLVVWVTDIQWRAGDLVHVFGELVRHVVESLVDAIERATLRSPAAAPDATAYRLLLEGRRCLETVDLPSLRRARKWFRQAIARAEGYAAPHADLARTLVLEYLVLGMTRPVELDEAARIADRAAVLDPSDWGGLRSRGLADLYARRHDASLERFARAARLAPNDADLHADYADALAFSGEPDRGLAMIRQAIDLNPLHPGYYDWILGSILFQSERYEEARLALDPVKDNPAVSRILAATCARAGDRKAAEKYARVLHSNYPGFRAEDLWRLSPNRRAEDTQRLVTALQEAGVP